MCSEQEQPFSAASSAKQPAFPPIYGQTRAAEFLHRSLFSGPSRPQNARKQKKNALSLSLSQSFSPCDPSPSLLHCFVAGFAHLPSLGFLFFSVSFSFFLGLSMAAVWTVAMLAAVLGGARAQNATESPPGVPHDAGQSAHETNLLILAAIGGSKTSDRTGEKMYGARKGA